MTVQYERPYPVTEQSMIERVATWFSERHGAVPRSKFQTMTEHDIGASPRPSWEGYVEEARELLVLLHALTEAMVRQGHHAATERGVRMEAAELVAVYREMLGAVDG